MLSVLPADTIHMAGEVQAPTIGVATRADSSPIRIVGSHLQRRSESVTTGGSPALEATNSAVTSGVVYSNLAEGSGYGAFPVATGVLGWDDYDSINDADINLTYMRFIGGVTAPNGVLEFEFYTSSGVFIREAVFTLPDAGNYIWDLTMPQGFVVPDAGRLQVRAQAGTQGQWLLSTAAPTVGTQNPSIGGGTNGYNHKFELTNTPPLPNLTPAVFAGWSDALVISTVPGTHIDAGQILQGNSIFVDYGVGNLGQASAGAFTSTLRLDGILVSTLNTTSLSVGYVDYVSDVNLGAVSAGLHTLTITVDSGSAVAEISESDNTYTRRFYVATDYNGEIHGVKWNDIDADGTRDEGEPGLSGWTIYLDLDGDGQFDLGDEPHDITDASGAYDLLNVPAGLYCVREVPQANWVQTFPGTSGRSNHDFQITVDFIDSSLTPSQQAAFAVAADRWAQIITGDVPDLYHVGFFIDDVRIDASAVAIDGVGGTLGQAGAPLLRAGSFLPGRGIMQFDAADLADAEADGTLGDIILHEMGHVLGFGTIWSYLGLLSGAGGSDPRFTGAAATAEYNLIFGGSQTSVPVENTGGPGTRDGHWRESILDTELMTGYLNGASRPLSRITAASMQDIGYQVDLSAADAYVAPGPAGLRQASALVNGYFLSLAGAPAIAEAPANAVAPMGLAGALLPASAHEVHVSPGQGVQKIDFGSRAITTISSVTPPADGWYRAGQNLDFALHFTDSVTVSGTPTINLTIGSTSRSVSYVTGSGSSTLIFRYTVQAGDNDGDGIASASPIALNGGSIVDAAGNPASLTFAPPFTAGVGVDTTAPTVTASRDGEAYAAAHGGWNNTDVTVSFIADDGGGSGLLLPLPTNQVFSNDGTYSSTAVTVTDLAGNVSAPSNVIGGILIDKTRPTVTIAPASGQPDPANALPVRFQVVFSEPVFGLTAGGFYWYCPLPSGGFGWNHATLTGSGSLYEFAIDEGLIGDGYIGVIALADGAADVAGNGNLESSLASLLYDPTAPAAPVIAAISEDTGAAGDGITRDRELILHGTAEAGSTVEILLGDSSIGTTPADASGNWSFDYTAVALDDGDYSLTASATDQAGNTSTPSDPFAVTIDSTPPTADLVYPVAGGSIDVNVLNALHYIDVRFLDPLLAPDSITDPEAEFLLGGAAAAGVSIDGAPTPQGDGVYRYRFSGAFGQGPVSVQFQAGAWADHAANTGTSESETFAVEVAADLVLLGQPQVLSGTTISLTYLLSVSGLPSFSIGLFRSSDSAFDGGDELLAELLISDPADLTAGTHTKTWTIGTGPGQVPLPGAGAAESDADYFLLTVADPANLVAETDADPFAEDNTAALEGVYRTAAGDLLLHGHATAADSIVIGQGSVTVLLNGTLYTYAEGDVASVRIRTHGGNDAVDGIASPVPLWVLGGDGNDSIIGGSLADTFGGGLGDDSLAGGGGADRLVESADVSFTLTDTSLTGRGNDVLAGIELAALTGGDTANTFTISGWTGSATLAGGGGSDTVLSASDADFTLTDFLLTRSTGGSFALAGIERASLTGGASANTLDASGFTGPVTLSGAAGNDLLLGGSSGDSLGGGDGHDTMNGGRGSDTVDGGAGTDTWIFDGTSADDAITAAGDYYTTKYWTGSGWVVLGTRAWFKIALNSSETDVTTSFYVAGSSTPSYPYGTFEHLRIGGLAGNDTITAASLPLGWLNGSPAIAPDLDGGDGNDAITGSRYADRITGGEGDDALTGGEGDDAYAFAGAGAAQVDTVQELAGQGTDHLDFADLGAGDALLAYLNGSTLLLASHTNRTINVAAAGQGAFLEHVIGGAAADTFDIVPHSTIGYTVTGGGPALPASPGDRLNIDLDGAAGASLTMSGPDAGQYTFSNCAPVGFTGVEGLNDVIAPALVSWQSVVTHANGIGEVGLVIADDGLFVEPRSAGVRTLRVQFSEAIDPASFTASSVALAGNNSASLPLDLSGIIVSASLSAGNTLGTLTFSSALPDFARYLIRLDGVTDAAGNLLGGDRDRLFTALVGDASGDRRVNSTDLSRVRNYSTGTALIDPANTAQVRCDLSGDGRVNSTDLSRVRAKIPNDARGIADPALPAGGEPAAAEAADAKAKTAEPAKSSASGPPVALARGDTYAMTTTTATATTTATIFSDQRRIRDLLLAAADYGDDSSGESLLA